MTFMSFAAAALLLLLSTLSATTNAQKCTLYRADAPFQATAWGPCPDIVDFANQKWSYPGWQCRNVTVPTTYTANRNGSLYVYERRFVKGTPKSVVYLVQGGPGLSAELLTLGSAQRMTSTVFTDDFAIYVQSPRGTYLSTAISSYPNFPSNLWNTLKAASYNYTDFSVTNTAMDLIRSLKNTKTEFPDATLNLIGFSFGTYVAQRVMTIEPKLLSSAILDSPIPGSGASNPFAAVTSGSEDLARYLLINCGKNDFCKSKTLDNNLLVSFLDSLNGSSNACVDAYATATGNAGANRQELVSNTIASLLSLPAMAINTTAFTQVNPSAGWLSFEVLKAVLQTAAMTSTNGKVYLDFRAIALAFVNQLAQCDAGSLARMQTFSQAMNNVLQVVARIGTGANGAFGSSSIIRFNAVTQILMLLSEGRLPPFTVEQGAEMAEDAFVRPPASYYNMESMLQSEIAKIPAFTDCYSNVAPKAVTARVIFLAGRLDAVVPFDASRGAFRVFKVNGKAGGKKTFFFVNNAGHMIIGFGQTKCTDNLIAGVVLRNTPLTTKFVTCIKAENAGTLDWELAALPQIRNSTVGLWAGLTSSFTAGPTKRPTGMPTGSPTPKTAKPTLSPTGKPTPPTSAPTSAAPSQAPTTLKDYCGSFKTAAKCPVPTCAWRAGRSVCSPP